MNGADAAFATRITELSLTGNQSYELMAYYKIKWTTVDDDTVVREVRDPIDTEETIELQQQRIRVFQVDYSTTSAFLQ